MKVAAIIVSFDYWYDDGTRDGTFAHRFAHALRDYNPGLKVLVVDNASARPYQANNLEILRLDERVGYGAALNAGLKHLQAGDYDWYICLNNDCAIDADGNVTRILSILDDGTLYGSGWNKDEQLRIDWQWSAWLIISRRILQAVGYFDENLAAAFEDFDYERRATLAGFKLDTGHLPIVHLDKHTRMDAKGYAAKWEAARLYFQQKHGLMMARWFTDKQIEKANEQND